MNGGTMLQEANRVHELNRRVQKVRRRLIEHSMPLAERVAARYQGESPALAHVDLEQEAMVGLIQAVNTFDRDKGASFKTWVEVKVKGAILDAIRKQGHAVHLSEKANGEYLAYERAVERLAQRYGAYPTDEEIAREMETTVERVRKVEAYVPAVVGLDVEDEDTGLTIEQTTPDDRFEFWPDYSESSEMILGALPGRDAFILEASSGADGRGKRSRARIAQVTELTEREVATELQRIKRRLRRDPRVLAIKKAAGYVTVEERKAESARRLATLPQHPPGAPLPEPVQPKRVPRPGVRRYMLTEAERLAVVARCEENSGKSKKSALQSVSYEKSARYSK
jgi:RNA polymerase sigma factor (sigma-70 family)